MDIVYLNGEYLHKKDASISIMDRGFLFGDAVYEVIPYFNGKPLELDAHLSRLDHSLESVNLHPPLVRSELHTIFKELTLQNNLSGKTFSIYLQISRGKQNTRAHSIPKTYTPTVVAYCMAKNQLQAHEGHKIITLEDTRHDIAQIKTTNLLSNILLYEQAKQCGAIEAVLLRNNTITECTSSNLFIVKDNQVATPALTPYMLPGITRQLVIRLCDENNIPCQEKPIKLTDLEQADEIWITSSTKQICPITVLNNKAVGSGNIGSMWHKIIKHYNTYKEAWKHKTHEK